jgi:transposase-like protein
VISEADAWQVIALAEQGANVSEIARQVGHDRKTIRT